MWESAGQPLECAVYRRLLRRLGECRRRLLPCSRISDANDSAREDLCKDAAPPIRAEGGLQARRCLVHALAWCQLASNRKATVTDAQHAASCVRETDTAKKHVGPPKRRILIDAKFRHAGLPCFRFEQRDLAT